MRDYILKNNNVNPVSILKNEKVAPVVSKSH